MQANAGESCRTVVFLKKTGRKSGSGLACRRLAAAPQKRRKLLPAAFVLRRKKTPTVFRDLLWWNVFI